MNFSFIISTCVIVCVTVVIRNAINQFLILEMVLFWTPFAFYVTTVHPSWLHNSTDPVTKYQVTKPVNYLFVGWAYNPASFRLFSGPLVLEICVTYLGPVHENNPYIIHSALSVCGISRFPCHFYWDTMHHTMMGLKLSYIPGHNAFSKNNLSVGGITF